MDRILRPLWRVVRQWVDERLGLTELAAFARHKQVPVHKHSFWYYWGGLSLFFFIVQCLTGVLLQKVQKRERGCVILTVQMQVRDKQRKDALFRTALRLRLRQQLQL